MSDPIRNPLPPAIVPPSCLNVPQAAGEALEVRKRLARRIDAEEMTLNQFERENERALQRLKAQRGGA